MKMKQLITTLSIIITITLSSFAQEKLTVEQYIQKYKDIARLEMQNAGIPASIKLAQGILESSFGNSDLSKNANNHFGIKCHKEWTGNTYHMDDDEANECFRVYKNPEESFHDHTYFLTSRSRYAGLFELSQTDYKGWAEGLQKAGYATNPKYASILIGLIERHELFNYDKPGGKEHKPFESHKHEVKESSPYYNSKEKVEIKQSEAIFVYNRLKAIRVLQGDDIRSISRRYNVPANNIATFNDIDINEDITVGSILYLQSKKKKAKQDKHLVVSNETMHDISQQYGIILDALLKKNLLNKGQEPANGQTIYLKKKALNRPSIRIKEVAPKVIPEKVVPEKKIEVIEIKKEVNIITPKVEEVKVSEEPKTEKPKVEEKIITPEPIIQIVKENTSSAITHIVEKGDTLYNLSKKYNVSVKDIIDRNLIEDFNIKLGQTLIIK